MNRHFTEEMQCPINLKYKKFILECLKIININSYAKRQCKIRKKKKEVKHRQLGGWSQAFQSVLQKDSALQNRTHSKEKTNM